MRALVGDDRHDVLAELGVAAQVAQQRVKPIVVDTAWPPEPVRSSANGASSGQRDRAGGSARAARDRAAERAPPLHHVLVLDRVLGGRKYGAVAVERRLGDLVVQVQPVAQASSCSLVIFLIWWVALRPSMSGRASSP